MILEDITQSIRSSLIIADVTPDNANVFYEVYAHGILANHSTER